MRVRNSETARFPRLVTRPNAELATRIKKILDESITAESKEFTQLPVLGIGIFNSEKSRSKSLPNLTDGVTWGRDKTWAEVDR